MTIKLKQNKSGLRMPSIAGYTPDATAIIMFVVALGLGAITVFCFVQYFKTV